MSIKKKKLQVRKTPEAILKLDKDTANTAVQPIKSTQSNNLITDKPVVDKWEYPITTKPDNKG